MNTHTAMYLAEQLICHIKSRPPWCGQSNKLGDHSTQYK